MLDHSSFIVNLSKLKIIANDIVNQSNYNELILLKGDLGSGKTTFTRFLIEFFYKKNKKKFPKSIKSPSYPILINYSLDDFEINHYDFYRLKDANELVELNFFDNLKNNISIVEWPDLLLKNFDLKSYLLVEFSIINSTSRKIEIINNIYNSNEKHNK